MLPRSQRLLIQRWQRSGPCSTPFQTLVMPCPAMTSALSIWALINGISRDGESRFEHQRDLHRPQLRVFLQDHHGFRRPGRHPRRCVRYHGRRRPLSLSGPRTASATRRGTSLPINATRFGVSDQTKKLEALQTKETGYDLIARRTCVSAAARFCRPSVAIGAGADGFCRLPVAYRPSLAQGRVVVGTYTRWPRRTFVIDGVAHCYNHAPYNRRIKRASVNSINTTSQLSHVACTPDALPPDL